MKRLREAVRGRARADGGVVEGPEAAEDAIEPLGGLMKAVQGLSLIHI